MGVAINLLREGDNVPYIDTSPVDSYIKIDEDNAIEQIGQILIDNGWTFVKSFFKAVGDTRAYYRGNDERTNYAFAQHFIYRNAEGKFLGMANVGVHSISYIVGYGEVIRRPYDDLNEKDPNFGMVPTWEAWARQKYADTAKNTSIFFYMLEKVPSDEEVPEGSLISITAMPGMSGTRLDIAKDRDSNYKKIMWWNNTTVVQQVELDKDDWDLEFNGKSLSASREYLIGQALDIEVYKTTWHEKRKEVSIDYAEPRVMQSPCVDVMMRPGILEYVNNPIYYTNWWTDSEIRLKGFVDSTTFNVVIQADSAPKFNGNAVPTIPLYYGKIIPIQEVNKDLHEPGYALFGGCVPPAETIETARAKGTILSASITKASTTLHVTDASLLPNAPSKIVISGKEIVEMVSKTGNKLEVIRGVGVNGKPDLEGPELEAELKKVVKDWKRGVSVRPTQEDVEAIEEQDPSKIISMFDFDNPYSRMADPHIPILKVYNDYPSNGLDSVMCSKTRYGARYQAHYLSFGAPPNPMPPARAVDKKKYPQAYNSMEKNTNYKYEFNKSKYSGKVHATPVYVVHPEDGVRGMLKYAIGFNSQSIGNSGLKVKTKDCPDKEYDKYLPNVVSAVSPLTKRPGVAHRPMGLGIFKEHWSQELEDYDVVNDKTPPGEPTIVKAVSNEVNTAYVEWTPPKDISFSGVNVYVEGKLYAKNVSGTNSYLVGGVLTGQEVVVELESIDLAGNLSAKVATEAIRIL